MEFQNGIPEWNSKMELHNDILEFYSGIEIQNGIPKWNSKIEFQIQNGIPK
jgi:hypothetical protein